MPNSLNALADPTVALERVPAASARVSCFARAKSAARLISLVDFSTEPVAVTSLVSDSRASLPLKPKFSIEVTDFSTTTRFSSVFVLALFIAVASATVVVSALEVSLIMSSMPCVSFCIPISSTPLANAPFITEPAEVIFGSKPCAALPILFMPIVACSTALVKFVSCTSTSTLRLGISPATDYTP